MYTYTTRTNALFFVYYVVILLVNIPGRFYVV